jgi:hypothetical protein
MNWKKKTNNNMYRLAMTVAFVVIFTFLGNAQADRSDRPEQFPTPPKSDNSLFFLQRNRNENTIVYDAKINEDGEFDRSEPIDVYWLRYTSTGYRRELKWIERTFAYGYSSKKVKNRNEFLIELTAYDKREIHLKKTKDGKPIATITCNGKECRLDYIYVFADESGSWPKGIHVDIHATDLVTGKKVKERIKI